MYHLVSIYICIYYIYIYIYQCLTIGNSLEPPVGCTLHLAPGEQNILVVAHRDSLRALFGHLEAVEAATVFDGTSQTAPLVYEFGNLGGTEG